MLWRSTVSADDVAGCQVGGVGGAACPVLVFRRPGVVCHALPMSSNIRFKLKLSPRGWVSMAFFATMPVTVPGLVNLFRSRPVHFSGLGYVLYAVAGVLIVVRQVRAATEVEAEGLRMHRLFSTKFLAWSEIDGVEIRSAGRVRLVQVRTLSGQMVRLSAPIAGGVSTAASSMLRLPRSPRLGWLVTRARRGRVLWRVVGWGAGLGKPEWLWRCLARSAKRAW